MINLQTFRNKEHFIRFSSNDFPLYSEFYNLCFKRSSFFDLFSSTEFDDSFIDKVESIHIYRHNDFIDMQEQLIAEARGYLK